MRLYFRQEGDWTAILSLLARSGFGGIHRLRTQRLRKGSGQATAAAVTILMGDSIFPCGFQRHRMRSYYPSALLLSRGPPGQAGKQVGGLDGGGISLKTVARVLYALFAIAETLKRVAVSPDGKNTGSMKE